MNPNAYDLILPRDTPVATFEPITEVVKEGSSRFDALAEVWLSHQNSSGDETPGTGSDKRANSGLHPVNEVNEGNPDFTDLKLPECEQLPTVSDVPQEVKAQVADHLQPVFTNQRFIWL